MQSAKRIMVTLRCEACGADLSSRNNNQTVLLQAETGAVFCGQACESAWNVGRSVQATESIAQRT